MVADAAADLRPVASRRASNTFAVFAVTWAVATLYHVWGPSGRAGALFSDVTALGVLHALAGAVAVVVLARPRDRRPLLVLAVLALPILWCEAPFTGSHWVVASLVDVALLLAFATSRVQPVAERRFFVLARWVLIGFYSFAAFAKLNHSFFTPRVSCGTYYFDELLGSLHLNVHSQAGGAWTHLVPVGVAVIELSIPVLLLVRRTRHVGVLVGLLFHGFIAFDQTHLFSDFSSVLVALFLLFLPLTFADHALAVFHGLGKERRDLVRAAVLVGCGGLLLLQWYGTGAAVVRLFDDGLGWSWVVYDVVVVGLVAHFLARQRPAPLERPLSFASAAAPKWLAIVPALVVLTGLSPYLELRTAYAFNMYSNLETADGGSNHFLITRTLRLTDFQSDLVRIESSSDPALEEYAIERFDIPFLQLRDYLSNHRDVALTYVRKGQRATVAHASDDPALVEPVPLWESKLFAFRSLDELEPNRCQPSFLSAL